MLLLKSARCLMKNSDERMMRVLVWWTPGATSASIYMGLQIRALLQFHISVMLPQRAAVWFGTHEASGCASCKCLLSSVGDGAPPGGKVDRRHRGLRAEDIRWCQMRFYFISRSAFSLVVVWISRGCRHGWHTHLAAGREGQARRAI